MINKNSIEYDSLTGLSSRWKIRMALQEIIDSGENRVFVYLDVDNFKSINEKYGNEKGDEALIAIGQALCKTYPGMIIARLSSDEFSVIIDASRYSRTEMNNLTHTLFTNLHEIHVEGMEGHRFSFSIAAVFIVPEHHTHPDLVIREAHELHKISKKHEGNYLSTLNGMIPDVEGAFLILREDRKLYNEINNHLFDTLNEESWLTNLQEGALSKEQMFHRNQSQLEDIYSYFRDAHLPDSEYDMLFKEIMRDAASLDVFMRCHLIENILLPHYERCDLSAPQVRSYLGHLYLLLAHSLISVVRMGDHTQSSRIIDYLKRAYQVCKDFPHDSIQFEPSYYALCEIVGHYESLDYDLFSKEECDQSYEMLRELTFGADPFIVAEKKVHYFFETIIDNAMLYPIYRVCILMMKGRQITEDEKAEIAERIDYIRQHQAGDCYDMVGQNIHIRRLTVYIQKMIFEPHSNKELLDYLLGGLRSIRNMEFGRLSESNLIVVSYFFLATSKVILKVDLPLETKIKISCDGLNFLLDILRSRESIASDHQLLLLVSIMIESMMNSPIMSSLDKVYYLEQILAAISLDTYSHCMAVSNYARVILANIIDHYPHLLVGKGCIYDTIEDAHANREQLLQFMDYVCRLHDIGKLSLVPIASNAFRRLTDQEFALIKKHCELGKQILHSDPSFALFEPVVYHHHRWFNEDNGYPAIPVNEHHYKLKILTDILSICDSIEAATSRVGRNYRRAKSFLQILDELIAESHSRYSRDVIDTIIGNTEVYLQIRSMVDLRWESLYRSIFNDVVLKQHVEYRHVEGELPDIYACSDQRPKQSSLVTQENGLMTPVFLTHMSEEARNLFIVSLLHINRMFVMRQNSLIFFYDVDRDNMDYVMCDEDGKFRHTITPNYSLNQHKEYISQGSYIKAMEMISKVVDNPEYPREGQTTIESYNKSKCLLATYSSVCDVNGKVKSVIGHLEDINTTKEKLLHTIERQNRYNEITQSIGELFEIVIYSNVELTHFELLKASSTVKSQGGNLTSTADFIQYTYDKLVDPESYDAFKEFIDMSTLDERLKNRPYISLEYKSRLSGWLFARIIPVSYDKQGKIDHIIFAAESAEVTHKEKEVLTELAKNDGLTGLMNRIYGEGVIRDEIAKGGLQIFAILDCDHFKRINDYLSHLVGDEVLRQQSSIMKKIFTGFRIMRLGGDEFVVHANGEVARQLIYSFDGINTLFRSFTAQLKNVRIKELENIAPTMSCGVIFCNNSIHPTFEEFYAMADNALKESKKKRGGCVTIREMC